jgi:hypothetical protein
LFCGTHCVSDDDQGNGEETSLQFEGAKLLIDNLPDNLVGSHGFVSG